MDVVFINLKFSEFGSKRGLEVKLMKNSNLTNPRKMHLKKTN